MTDRTTALALRPTFDLDRHISPTDATLATVSPAVADALRELHVLSVTSGDTVEDRQYLDLRARFMAVQEEFRTLQADYHRTGNKKTRNLADLVRRESQQLSLALRTADDTRRRRDALRSARCAELRRYVEHSLGIIKQVGELEVQRANGRAAIAEAELKTTRANIELRKALREEAGDGPVKHPVPESILRARLTVDADLTTNAASNAYAALRRRARENGASQVDADAFAASALEELFRLGLISPPSTSMDPGRTDAMNIAAAARRTGR